MVRVPGCNAVYDVANQWRERCLSDDKSLLWPEEVTWKVENLDRARDGMDALVKAKTTTGGNMKEAFANEPLPVRRAIADAMAIWTLFPSSMGKDVRRNLVAYVASWTGENVDRDEIDRAIEEDIGSREASYFAPGFQLQRGAHLRFILGFASQLKLDNINPHDLVACSALSERVLGRWGGGDSARNMVLHALFPDQVEAVFNQWAKTKIVNATRFSEYVHGVQNVDISLIRIREGLTKRLGRRGLTFYDADIRRMWSPMEIEKGHRYWKIAPGERGKRWNEFLRFGIISVGWAGSPDFRSLDANEHIGFRAQLQSIETMKDKNYNLDHASKQLWYFWQEMSLGDLVCAYSDGKVFGWGEITGDYSYEEDPRGYPHRRAVKWRHTVPTQAGRLPKSLRDKLSQNTTIIELTKDDFQGIVADEAHPLLGLSAATNLDLDDLQEIESLLLEKKQLIFEGPPGCGKTFIADLFARYFTGNPLEGEHNEQIEVVQFHQSYGYEDFVQGIRPVTDGEGRLQYRVMPGIFLQHCDRAKANPEKRFVLIIDEINRGNLSRIFGELLMLLEYREKRVRLPYSAGDGTAASGPTHLEIPPNLYLIGTMNSTDRSLSMIDYALRRRFFFYRLLPVVDGQATTLDRWMAGKEFSAADRERVVAYFIRINTEIGEKLSADFQIGHSYFMTTDIATTTGLNRVWRRALKPLLEEYFHTARGLDEVIAALAPETMRPVRAVANPIDHLDGPIESNGLSAHEE